MSEMTIIAIGVVVAGFVVAFVAYIHNVSDTLESFRDIDYSFENSPRLITFTPNEEHMNLLSFHELKQLASVYDIETDNLTREEICDIIVTYFK